MTEPLVDNPKSEHFTLHRSIDAYGHTIGFDRNAYLKLHLLQPFNDWAAAHYRIADEELSLLRMLELAYQKGHADAKHEIREVLGVRPPERT